jgi:hypothetical protein
VVKGLFLCLALDSMVVFMIGTPCLNNGRDYGYFSSMGQPRLDSVGLLVYDSRVHIQGTSIVL